MVDRVGPTENVECEAVTFKGKRIDILLELPELVICIENKINAKLDNDLCNYQEHCGRLAKPENKAFVGIVLAPRRLDDRILKSSRFVSITYTELVEKIRLSMGEYMARENTKFHYLLFDFIEQSRRLNGEHSMLEEEDLEFLEFWTKNPDTVQFVLDRHATIQKNLFDTVSSFRETLKKELNQNSEFKIYREPNISNRTVCYFDLDIYREFRFPERELYLDVSFTPLTVEFSLSKAQNAKTDLLSNVVDGLRERQKFTFSDIRKHPYKVESSSSEPFGSPLKVAEYANVVKHTLEILRGIASECDLIASNPDPQIKSLVASR